MGNLVNPISVRLSKNIYWNSQWVSYQNNKYSFLVSSDYLIYAYLNWFFRYKYFDRLGWVIFFSHYKIIRFSSKVIIIFFLKDYRFYKFLIEYWGYIRKLLKRLKNNFSLQAKLNSLKIYKKKDYISSTKWYVFSYQKKLRFFTIYFLFNFFFNSYRFKVKKRKQDKHVFLSKYFSLFTNFKEYICNIYIFILSYIYFNYYLNVSKLYQKNISFFLILKHNKNIFRIFFFKIFLLFKQINNNVLQEEINIVNHVIYLSLYKFNFYNKIWFNNSFITSNSKNTSYKILIKCLNNKKRNNTLSLFINKYIFFNYNYKKSINNKYFYFFNYLNNLNLFLINRKIYNFFFLLKPFTFDKYKLYYFKNLNFYFKFKKKFSSDNNFFIKDLNDNKHLKKEKNNFLENRLKFNYLYLGASNLNLNFINNIVYKKKYYFIPKTLINNQHYRFSKFFKFFFKTHIVNFLKNKKNKKIYKNKRFLKKKKNYWVKIKTNFINFFYFFIFKYNSNYNCTFKFKFLFNINLRILKLENNYSIIMQRRLYAYNNLFKKNITFLLIFRKITNIFLYLFNNITNFVYCKFNNILLKHTNIIFNLLYYLLYLNKYLNYFLSIYNKNFYKFIKNIYYIKKKIKNFFVFLLLKFSNYLCDFNYNILLNLNKKNNIDNVNKDNFSYIINKYNFNFFLFKSNWYNNKLSLSFSLFNTKTLAITYEKGISFFYFLNSQDILRLRKIYIYWNKCLFSFNIAYKYVYLKRLLFFNCLKLLNFYKKKVKNSKKYNNVIKIYNNNIAFNKLKNFNLFNLYNKVYTYSLYLFLLIFSFFFYFKKNLKLIEFLNNLSIFLNFKFKDINILRSKKNLNNLLSCNYFYYKNKYNYYLRILKFNLKHIYKKYLYFCLLHFLKEKKNNIYFFLVNISVFFSKQFKLNLVWFRKFFSNRLSNLNYLNIYKSFNFFKNKKNLNFLFNKKFKTLNSYNLLKKLNYNSFKIKDFSDNLAVFKLNNLLINYKDSLNLNYKNYYLVFKKLIKFLLKFKLIKNNKLNAYFFNKKNLYILNVKNIYFIMKILQINWILKLKNNLILKKFYKFLFFNKNYNKNNDILLKFFFIKPINNYFNFKYDNKFYFILFSINNIFLKSNNFLFFNYIFNVVCINFYLNLIKFKYNNFILSNNALFFNKFLIAFVYFFNYMRWFNFFLMQTKTIIYLNIKLAFNKLIVRKTNINIPFLSFVESNAVNYFTASLLSKYIISNLKIGHSLNRIIYPLMKQLSINKNKFYYGWKFGCFGRFKRQGRARKVWYGRVTEGVPLSRVNSTIDYSTSIVRLRNGICCVKVFMYIMPIYIYKI